MLAATLLVGFLTPLVVMLALLVHVVMWLTLGTSSVTMVIVVVLDAWALALLGPGAFSIDSYRFGRRVVELPPP